MGPGQGIRHLLPGRARGWREASTGASLELICRVNGSERQRARSTDMHFSIPELVSFISGIMTLEPGDLIATGTPAGTAPLADGDVVEVEIPGVGVLSQPRTERRDPMIEFSDRLAEPARLSAGRDPDHQAPADRSGDGRDRPGRGRQRHAAARRRGRGDAGGAARPGAQQVRVPAGAAGIPQAASRWVERRFGMRFDPATETLPLIGSKEGLSHLPLAVINPGDVAIVPEPGYQAYLGGSLLAGAEPYIAPLRPENGFLLELDRIPEAVLKRAKIVFVNYPNNPTAAVATPEYLERTVAVCRRHGILLAYDNAYCDLTFDGYRAPSIFEIAGARDVALEFFSLSKSFSMTGWRLGFAVGRAELIGALTRVKSYVDTGPFLAVQKAGAAALDQAEALVEPIRAELERRRDAAVAALREAGFAVEAPKAAMYLWVALPDGVASAPFAKRALEETGAVVLPGSAFGPAGEGFFRIALTVGAERLREAAPAAGPDARGNRIEGCLPRPLDLAACRGRRAADRGSPSRPASRCTCSCSLFGWIGGRHARGAAPAAAAHRAGPPAEGPQSVEMRYQTGPAARRRDRQRPDGRAPGSRRCSAGGPSEPRMTPEPPALPPPPPDTGWPRRRTRSRR